MLRIFGVLFASLGLGALLAVGGDSLPASPGVLGALILVVAAIAARIWWERRARIAGDDPGIPEREVWQAMVGTAMICGFVIVVLLTPGSEVHSHNGDTGGRESWTMIGGALLSWLIIRNPQVKRDERDRAIAALGLKVGYISLALLLIILSLNLGFAPSASLKRVTHWLLANILLALLMLACLAQYAAQLLAYWRDARPD